MRYLKQQNLNKFRRSDATVLTDVGGRVNMRTTASLLLPKGREDQRSGAVENGMIRYNTDIADIEVYAKRTLVLVVW